MSSSPGTIRPVLWTLAALVVLALSVVDVLTGDDDSGVNIELDEAEEPATVAEAEPPASEVLYDLVMRAATSPELDVEEFRAALHGQRWRLNAEIISDVATQRIRWIDGFGRLLEYLTLAGLLMLLGPLWLARTRPTGGRELAIRSIPYFAVASAALVLLTKAVTGLVVSVEKLETVVSTAGTITASIADATLHYLYTATDEDLRAAVALFLEARTSMATNPFHSADLVSYLWRGFSEVRNSGVLMAGSELLVWVSRLVELYGPLLAVATFLVTVQVAVPVILNLLRYPVEAVEGRDGRSVGRFALDQLKVFWRELCAFGWMVLFILTFTAGAVVLTRLLTFPMVTVNLRVILAANKQIASGGTLPDVGVFLSLLSTSLTLLSVFFFVVVPAGVIFSRGYTVVRERLMTRRKFRDFPLFWKALRGLSLRVTGLAIIAVGLVLGLYALVWPLAHSPVTRAWLPAPVFVPVFALITWRLRLGSRLWRLARLDPCALPPPPEAKA